MDKQTPAQSPNQQSDIVRHWLGEITAARKREKDWRKEGKRVQEIYNGKKKDQIPFNILYSNTETLLPALYNQQPRPVVQRRFKDEDPVGKAASEAGKRILEFAVDTNSEEYASFDSAMADAVLDAALPGRAGTRLRYDAKIVGAEGQRVVQYELVCYESLKWDRWTHGFARKWSRVPWVAFEHDVTMEEAVKLFGQQVADKLVFTEVGRTDDREESEAPDDAEKTDEERKIAKVWEIWVKNTKKVCFISPNYQEGYLKEDEDPLQLTGFYPMPEPLRFLRKANNLEPTTLYSLYENQAKELNRITVRINRIVEALKVRGAYDASIKELDGILKQDDNAMVAASNVAALMEKGLEGAIWLMPLDKLITVLQQLYMARDNCKRVIYEVTGISDILRGSTVASETATAQQIKNQWGTLRLKRLQRDVANYARELLRITLEIAAKKFEEKTFVSMTGLPFATTQEVQAAEGQAAALRSQIAMQQQPDPKQVQAVQATLSKPQWAKVMAMLRNDTQRQYRVDVETNSTVDVEATEDKQMMSEILGAISQFLQGVTPLIVRGAMPFQVAQSMLLAIVRRYRFGPELEDYIKQMQPPKDPDAGKAQAEQQKQAAEAQKMQADQQREQEKHQMEMAKAQREQDNAKEIAMLELEVKREEARIKREELQAKAEFNKLMAAIKLREATAKVEVAEELAKIEVAKAKAMPTKEPSSAGA